VDEGDSIMCAAGVTSNFKFGASMQGFFKAGRAPPLSLVFNGGVVFHYLFFLPFYFNGLGGGGGWGFILKTHYSYPIFAEFCDKR
jgi:hypothetical protein